MGIKYRDIYSLPSYLTGMVPASRIFLDFDLQLQDQLAYSRVFLLAEYYFWVLPGYLRVSPPSAPTLLQARRRSFETHAATTKQRNKISRSWTPCATFSASRSTRCAPRLSKQMSLSPSKNKAVGIAGFAQSAGPHPLTKTSCDTVGAAPWCSTAASAVLGTTGKSTSSCARA